MVIHRLPKKFNIYGFCIYHYWFEGHQLLEKPAELLLKSKEIDINYCFSWANHSWTNSLSRLESKTLIQQTYGDKEDWIRHIEYLSQFFKDERYIKVHNKPILVIYDLKAIKNFQDMKKVFNDYVRTLGFDGIYFISTLKEENDCKPELSHMVDAQFEYQPRFALGKTNKINYSFFYNYRRFIDKTFLNRVCKISYDRVWNLIFKRTPNDYKTFLGAYFDWDTTARWSNKGEVHIGQSCDKFRKYFDRQVKRSIELNNEFLFFTAWNEWSEGAYIEPDTKNRYSALEIIKEILNKNEKSN